MSTRRVKQKVQVRPEMLTRRNHTGPYEGESFSKGSPILLCAIENKFTHVLNTEISIKHNCV